MSNDIVASEIYRLIDKIIYEIKRKNLNIYELSEKLCYSTDAIISLVERPVRNISVYYEILDVIESL